MIALLAGACFVISAGQFDTLPVNERETWVGRSSTHVMHTCIDASTPAGRQKCMSVELAPLTEVDQSVKLTFEAPSLVLGDGSRTTVDPTVGSTVKVKSGSGVPQLKPTFVNGRREPAGVYDGILMATAFALPSNTSETVLQMMVSQMMTSSSFRTRAIPLFSYNGGLEDDVCLGDVDTTGLSNPNLEQKCPNTKALRDGEFKYTFIFYQHIDCANCMIVLRNKVQAHRFYKSIMFNENKTLDTIGNDQISTIRFRQNSTSLDHIDIEFPSTTVSGLLTKQISNSKGANVTVTKIDDSTFYMHFIMAAPGNGQWIAYDPSATSVTQRRPKETSNAGPAKLQYWPVWFLATAKALLSPS